MALRQANTFSGLEQAWLPSATRTIVHRTESTASRALLRSLRRAPDLQHGVLQLHSFSLPHRLFTRTLLLRRMGREIPRAAASDGAFEHITVHQRIHA